MEDPFDVLAESEELLLAGGVVQGVLGNSLVLLFHGLGSVSPWVLSGEGVLGGVIEAVESLEFGGVMYLVELFAGGWVQ